jgi:hypothetical protein
MWILTEMTFEYDDERYSANGGYTTRKAFKSKEEAQRLADLYNVDFIRGSAMSEYWEYEWAEFKDEFFKLWDEHAEAISVHREFELPADRDSPAYEFDHAFDVLMEVLPDEKVLEFMNEHLRPVCWGVQEVEVVE